jgi:hypothetical protein
VGCGGELGDVPLGGCCCCDERTEGGCAPAAPKKKGMLRDMVPRDPGAHRISARPSPPHDSYLGVVEDAKGVDSHAQVLFSAVCTSYNFNARREYESVIYSGDE